MTLSEIYTEFTPGSQGFVRAVQTHCGFDMTDAEVERIAERCKTAEAFQHAWEDESWWSEEQNFSRPAHKS